jgi:choline kinase
MTKVVILAAGQGTRLRPLTDERPKCLVELLGKSLLSRQIEVLESRSVTDIHVVTGYLSEQISGLGLVTTYNEEYLSTNMVASLFCAIEYIRSCTEDLLIAYGDIVYCSKNLDAILQSDAELSLMIDSDWRSLWTLRFDNPLDDAETLKIDADGCVTEIGKTPSSYEEIQGQYTGLIKIRADKIQSFVEAYLSVDTDLIFDGRDFRNMYMTSFIQYLIDARWHVQAVQVKSGWLEIDSVTDLLLYEQLNQSGGLARFIDLV